MFKLSNLFAFYIEIALPKLFLYLISNYNNICFYCFRNVFRPRSTGSWSTILGVGNMVYPPHLRTRRKTYSESSESSSVGDGPLDLSSASSSVDKDPKSIISSQSPFK